LQPSSGSIWAISAGNASPDNHDPAATPALPKLYFTAGPNHGSGGLFGYLTAFSTQLVQATINMCSSLSIAHPDGMGVSRSFTIVRLR
jgi:hypothetical protein